MAMKQMTEEQAIALWNSKRWESWSDEQIAHFQLHQERICIPYYRFHGALQAELGRPVLLHELGNAERLIEEYEGKRDKPTLLDIREMLPLEDTIIVEVPDDRAITLYKGEFE